jgi:hypothetical protein
MSALRTRLTVWPALLGFVGGMLRYTSYPVPGWLFELGVWLCFGCPCLLFGSLNAALFISAVQVTLFGGIGFLVGTAIDRIRRGKSFRKQQRTTELKST